MTRVGVFLITFINITPGYSHTHEKVKIILKTFRIQSLSIINYRERLCRHESGRNVECWLHQNCDHRHLHAVNTQYSQFYTFYDDCRGSLRSRSCSGKSQLLIG